MSWLGEVVWQARASLVGDHFLYSCVACHPQVVKRLMGWLNREKKWVITFDEGEHILMVLFLRKSLSRVLWTSPKGIDCDAMRFQALGAILDELTAWLCGTNSLDLMSKCFLGCLELKTPTFFFCAISTIKKLLQEIECTLLIFDYY